MPLLLIARAAGVVALETTSGLGNFTLELQQPLPLPPSGSALAWRLSRSFFSSRFATTTAKLLSSGESRYGSDESNSKCTQREQPLQPDQPLLLLLGEGFQLDSADHARGAATLDDRVPVGRRFRRARFRLSERANGQTSEMWEAATSSRPLSSSGGRHLSTDRDLAGELEQNSTESMTTR